MLVVASDRVSAFDHVLSPGIPGKGVLLTTLSLWWFDQLAGGDGGRGIPNHLAASAHRARRGTTAPRDCIAHPGGGHGPRDGRQEPRDAADRVRRARLPDRVGLGRVPRRTARCAASRCPRASHNGDRLPAPIFTPAFKAPMGEHDENISFERPSNSSAPTARRSCATCRSRSTRAPPRTAEERGLILADTKFEFGIDDAGRHDARRRGAHERLVAVLGCRGLGGRARRREERMASFDKQIVRDWLAANWDETGTPPELPAEIVEQTADRYRELLERLTA